MPLPASFTRYAARGPDFAGFLERLPRTVQQLLGEWDLTRDGEPRHGFCALVLPVRTSAGRPAALKVAFPREESDHEHLALRRWAGQGAVELLGADPHRSALLLERLHLEDLADLGGVQACEVVAGLYPLLHVPAPPQLRRLSSYADRWATELAALPRDAPVPHRLVEQASALARDLAVDPDTDGTTVHGDLHYANVLAGDRKPWLAIDPKPLSGDPHVEPAPMLWNRWWELAGGVRGGVRRRFHALVDGAGLDEARARDWVVVRMMVQATKRLEEGPVRGRVTSTPDFLTQRVAIAKAVQD